jgi:hypothetical protein
VKRIILLCAAVLGLSACGGHGSTPAAAPAAKPAVHTTPTTANDLAHVLSEDRSAQISLRNALTVALVSYTDNSSYRLADIATLQSFEPSLKFVAGPSTGPAVVSVPAAQQDQIWWATVRSASGRCFGVEDNAQVGTFYAGGRTVLKSCRAPATDPYWTDTGWS